MDFTFSALHGAKKKTYSILYNEMGSKLLDLPNLINILLKIVISTLKKILTTKGHYMPQTSSQARSQH